MHYSGANCCGKNGGGNFYLRELIFENSWKNRTNQNLQKFRATRYVLLKRDKQNTCSSTNMELYCYLSIYAASSDDIWVGRIKLEAKDIIRSFKKSLKNNTFCFKNTIRTPPIIMWITLSTGEISLQCLTQLVSLIHLWLSLTENINSFYFTGIQ